MEIAVLKVQNITKSFKGKTILQRVSFQLKEKEIVGLLGANGAGKSTCMKMIAGLYKVDEGNITLLQCNPFKQWDQLYNQVGILLEPTIPVNLTGMEFLKHIAILRGQSSFNLKDLLHLCGLASAANKKVKTYSFGMKQRLGLAAALIGKPKFLMLDEPFVGLDPLGIHDLQQILKELAENGTAILLSSHQLAEIQPLVSRILFLKNGIISRDISEVDHVNLHELFQEEAQI